VQLLHSNNPISNPISARGTKKAEICRVVAGAATATNAGKGGQEVGDKESSDV
jgi:hypothetical protein